MIDSDLIQELKDRLADKYTAAELCDLLNVPVEDIIEEYFHLILKNKHDLFEEEFKGMVIDEDEDDDTED